MVVTRLLVLLGATRTTGNRQHAQFHFEGRSLAFTGGCNKEGPAGPGGAQLLKSLKLQVQEQTANCCAAMTKSFHLIHLTPIKLLCMQSDTGSKSISWSCACPSISQNQAFLRKQHFSSDAATWRPQDRAGHLDESCTLQVT